MNILPARAGLSTREGSAVAAGPGIGLGSGRVDVVGVEANLIVDLALLGITKNVVRFRKSLELLLRGLVPGIHVGVIFTRKFAECLADFVRRGGLLHAQNFVIFSFGGGCHSAVSAKFVLSLESFASPLVPRRAD